MSPQRQGSAGSDAPCYLLNTPTEIRLRIYGYHIANHPAEPFLLGNCEGIRLAQVCRSIRAEFLPDFWKRSEFKISVTGSPETISEWERKVGPEDISKIQVISIWNGPHFGNFVLSKYDTSSSYGILTAHHVKAKNSEGWIDTITLKFESSQAGKGPRIKIARNVTALKRLQKEVEKGSSRANRLDGRTMLEILRRIRWSNYGNKKHNDAPFAEIEQEVDAKKIEFRSPVPRFDQESSE